MRCTRDHRQPFAALLFAACAAGPALAQGFAEPPLPVAQSFSLPLLAVRPAAGDVDGDGRAELLAAHASGDELLLLAWEEESLVVADQLPAPVAGPFNVLYPHLADMNGDGHLDALGQSAAPCTVRSFPGDGAGGFGASKLSGAGTNAELGAVGDMDGDGDLDLLLASGAIGQDGFVQWMRGTGDGKFGAAQLIGHVRNPQDLAAADLDGNGTLDVVLLEGAVMPGKGRPVVVWRGLGGAAFGPGVAWGTGVEQALRFAVADFSGDGLPDVLVGALDDGEGALLRARATGSLGPPQPIGLDGMIYGVAAADLDLDGSPDVVGTDVAADAVVSLRLVAGHPSGEPLATPVTGLFLDDPLAADLDGDGLPDVAVAKGGGALVLINQLGAGAARR